MWQILLISSSSTGGITPFVSRTHGPSPAALTGAPAAFTHPNGGQDHRLDVLSHLFSAAGTTQLADFIC